MVTETDHTGRVNTMTWTAGKYEGKFLRDMTQTNADSIYGTASIHRYNMQYSSPGRMTEYDEDGVVNHVEGEAGTDVPFTYKLHRSNITYNLSEVSGYDETRWEQPPDTSTWTDDLSTWTKITTHVEMSYLDQAMKFGPDVNPDPACLKQSTITTQVENPDGSYRTETATTSYTYDTFTLKAASGSSEFSGLAADWYSYTDAAGHTLSRTPIKDAAGNTTYEYSYVDSGTNAKVVVDEADVTSTLVKGSPFKGTTELTYDVFYGSPVVIDSNTETEFLGADNATVVTVSSTETQNTYGLENNTVRLLETNETTTTSQPALDPAGTHTTTRIMTTTYTYNENGYLAAAEGNGTETGWEYAQEKGFMHPYTSTITVSYEIKLDKAHETYVDEMRLYDGVSTN